VFLTNEQFSQAKPLTNTNPQQSQFHWGKAELLHYKSKWGVPLQGVLIYPSDYQPGRLYPMITYIYERLSQGLHSYGMPSLTNPYNAQTWSQNGYFVYMPDIAYRTNQPGESAVDCLEPAIGAVIAKKVGVNPDKIGLVGHSWGGYQAAYVPTRTKVFKAAVAGAPLTELTSMYNSFYWNAGITNQQIFESSQGRFEGPWWESSGLTEHFLTNSPVWNAKNLEAPMLIAFGDQDGAVDWHQGQYYYNTLRRMGKKVVLLVYPGENHGLAKKPNQKDYQHRVLHWFDVYLKNAPPEPWVKEGVPAIKKGDGG
jgi:dipeptidyl aminopeptidase/acylaminoacyl peptidase